MKKLAAVTIACLLLLFVSAPAQSVPATPANYVEITAPLDATPGYHNHTFYSCTVDNRRAKMYVRYEIGFNDIRLDTVYYETNWGGHPGFLANALRIDVEHRAASGPGIYVELSPAWGGSSADYDDVPSYLNRIYVGNAPVVIEPNGSPKMRVRFYGVGDGAVGGRCDDDYFIE